MFQAKRKPLLFRNPLFNNQLLWTPCLLFGPENNVMIREHNDSTENWDKLLQSCEPIERFLEFRKSCDQLEVESEVPLANSVSTAVSEDLGRHDKGNGSSDSSFEQYIVPLSLIERWGSVMGILIFFLIAESIFEKTVDDLSLKKSLRENRYRLS